MEVSAQKKTSVFDSLSNLTEERNYFNKDSVWGTTTYKIIDFDRAGNWLKKVSFLNGKPSAIIKRKIEYFNE